MSLVSLRVTPLSITHQSLPLKKLKIAWMDRKFEESVFVLTSASRLPTEKTAAEGLEVHSDRPTVNTAPLQEAAEIETNPHDTLKLTQIRV